MEVVETDVVVVGGGGAGLSAAIAAAELDPAPRILLVSKVLPMRSHTVAAEGGSAGVVLEQDSLANHFDDTVSGGDWLCDQDAVDFFVERCTEEMTRLEHWGCPWSRREDGTVNVRAFGGMKTERTWFAADRTGFHILHTLFQTSLAHRGIERLDEHFCVDLVVQDGRCHGVVVVDIAGGDVLFVQARAVVLATGGAGRVYRQNTNAGIVTGDGMGMAYRNGVALRDMEFVQWHPTTLPGTGILITEGCRGEGGLLYNAEGRRYLQDYGLGPPDPWPRKKAMELGPRDRLSQAFWHEERAGRTIETPGGQAVHLDLRHLGEARLRERLPQIVELAHTFVGIDPVTAPIPVRPAVHYTMGGILTDVRTATRLEGLYACGECASVGIHGANRLGSNSLAELSVFGRVAGQEAARHAGETGAAPATALERARAIEAAALAPLSRRTGGERLADVREAMMDAMEEGVGIYRDGDGMREACDRLAALHDRLDAVSLDDRSRAFNTEWLSLIELGFMIDVAEAMAHSALAREESRGAHQRIDGFEARDDERFLAHTLARFRAGAAPEISHEAVNITRSPPRDRVYGGAAAATKAATDEQAAKR
ncbi:MAG: fumarate reductase (quinol) flavoprotein subunit [Pseudomonadales bacterium]|nr:fumarate reductase (quinol) flavoprotein subunit [Pseudomonadales bacterium]